MNIAVTGGAGFIGSHTCVALLNEGHRVVAFDNFYNAKETVIENIKKITGKEFIFYNADMTVPDDLEKIFSENEIDCVIHFAGYKAVGESVEIPLAYYHNNIYGTICLLEKMRKYHVKRIIFSSSATVYGNPASLPIREDFPRSATNPYGRTKLIIEDLLQDLWRSEPQWSVILLRYFNPVGAHESGLLCEDPKGIPNNIMPRILDVAGGKTPYITVFGNDYDTKDGSGVRDYIHVSDLAFGHVKALAYAAAHETVEAVNLGTGTGYSVFDLIRTFEEVNQVEIPYRVCARRAGDIDACYADPAKAKALFGWSAKRGLEDMCRDAYRARRKLEE